MHDTSLAAFLMILIFCACFGSAYSQSPNGISANTNKESYEPGDKVIITGMIGQIVNRNPVTIIVRNPIGNVYDVGQVTLMNNLFVHDFVISDDSRPGTYTVDIRQGNQTEEIHFELTITQLQTIPVLDSQIKVRGNNTSLVKYGQVKISTTDNSIMIPVDTTRISGESISEEYQIPKHVIDAPGGQLAFKENGNETDCTQTETNTERILGCPLQAGTKEIMIIGTIVIPEFGPISLAIMTMVSFTVLVIFTKCNTRHGNCQKL